MKTFAEGETMVLIYKNTSGGTVTAVSEALAVGDIAADGKSADFTFTLTDTDIDKSQAVTYVYPAAMANTDGTVNYGALATQDGTLNTLASTLDYCTNSGAWTKNGNLPSGVKAVAKVCYVSGGKGLALALSDWGNMSWNTAMHNLTYNPPTPSVPGRTWTLATKTEWNNMISAAGGYAALRDGFSSVGGNNMFQDNYLSSTENGSNVWYIDFKIGYWSSDGIKSNSYFNVRACLKF